MSDKPAWQYRRRDEGTLHGPYGGEKIVAWFGQPQDAEKAANLEVRIEHQSRSKSNAVEPLVSCSADTATLIASRSYAYNIRGLSCTRVCSFSTNRFRVSI